MMCKYTLIFQKQGDSAIMDSSGQLSGILLAFLRKKQ